MAHRRSITLIRRAYPSGADIEIGVIVEPGERRRLRGREGDAFPGSPPTAEIDYALVHAGPGRVRRLNNAEQAWLAAFSEELEQEALRAAANGENGFHQ